MVRGARQVGKSTLVWLLAKKLGLNLIEVNLERYPGLSSEFAAMDVKRIVREIDLFLKLGPDHGERLAIKDLCPPKPRFYVLT
jgi:hypothetical protein